MAAIEDVYVRFLGAASSGDQALWRGQMNDRGEAGPSDRILHPQEKTTHRYINESNETYRYSTAVRIS